MRWFLLISACSGCRGQPARRTSVAAQQRGAALKPGATTTLGGCQAGATRYRAPLHGPTFADSEPAKSIRLRKLRVRPRRRLGSLMPSARSAGGRRGRGCGAGRWPWWAQRAGQPLSKHSAWHGRKPTLPTVHSPGRRHISSQYAARPSSPWPAHSKAGDPARTRRLDGDADDGVGAGGALVEGGGAGLWVGRGWVQDSGVWLVPQAPRCAHAPSRQLAGTPASACAGTAGPAILLPCASQQSQARPHNPTQPTPERLLGSPAAPCQPAPPTPHPPTPTPPHLALLAAHGDDVQRVLRRHQRLLVDAVHLDGGAAPRILPQLQVGAGRVQQVVEHLPGGCGRGCG